jgi:hypothetical protein
MGLIEGEKGCLGLGGVARPLPSAGSRIRSPAWNTPQRRRTDLVDSSAFDFGSLSPCIGDDSHSRQFRGEEEPEPTPVQCVSCCRAIFWGAQHASVSVPRRLTPHMGGVPHAGSSGIFRLDLLPVIGEFGPGTRDRPTASITFRSHPVSSSRAASAALPGLKSSSFGMILTVQHSCPEEEQPCKSHESPPIVVENESGWVADVVAQENNY